MVKNMRAFIDLCRSRKGRIALNVSSAVLGIGVAVLAAQHFAETGWPLANADFQLVAAAGGFFLRMPSRPLAGTASSLPGSARTRWRSQPRAAPPQ
jgi:hypothetical protein